jgi:hypothetical protein
MSLILGANQLTAGGYEVDNSLRFNSGSTDNLQRTFTSSGNRQIYTLSFWVKKTVINQVNYIFESLQDGNNFAQILFASDTIEVESYISSSQFKLVTTQLFRDVSAWYNILLAVDTTQATNTNRVKMYVNGTQITAFNTANYPTQNTNTFFNQNKMHTIGANTFSGFAGLLNGYISEFYWIDGQALDPTSFGQTDSATGIWQPKAYTGSFGTNGFYLEFKDSSALGDDTSGNGNDFTVNNLTSVDQSTDTCTNNFCTLNPLFAGSTAPTITEGNLKTTGTIGDYQAAMGTIPASTTGKWYWEFKSGSNVNGSSTETLFGAVRESRLMATNNQSKEYAADGITVYGSVDSIGSGDIIGVYVDRAAAELKIYKNDVLVTTKTSLFNENLFPLCTVYGSGINAECNFGNAPYTVTSGNADPDGYGNFEYDTKGGYAINTKNLATYG